MSIASLFTDEELTKGPERGQYPQQRLNFDRETNPGPAVSTEEFISCSWLKQTSNKGVYVLEHLGLVRQKHIVIRTWHGNHTRRGKPISTDFSCLSVNASNALE